MSTVTTDKTTPAETGNPIQRLQRFLEEVKVELKKVTWPTLEEVRQMTIAVIVSSFAVAAMIYVMDIIISRLVKIVL